MILIPKIELIKLTKDIREQLTKNKGRVAIVDPYSMEVLVVVDSDLNKFKPPEGRMFLTTDGMFKWYYYNGRYCRKHDGSYFFMTTQKVFVSGKYPPMKLKENLLGYKSNKVSYRY